jgi:hypothetical protein
MLRGNFSGNGSFALQLPHKRRHDCSQKEKILSQKLTLRSSSASILFVFTAQSSFLATLLLPSLPVLLTAQQNLAIKDESIVHIDDDIAVLGMKLSLLIWMQIVLTQAQ